ncbi:hypothetical protein HII36_35060 [Nonomuraea sp. NN258]|uniref:hypothetical protein n=1 Tax=Nonomuraea antri TaxID=2730852 RepID=UPI001568FDC5|nr:hypothetical protein [Nonomuraea antri]NRQ37020.1 hypothetical protein [Nonomuraea antri]
MGPLRRVLADLGAGRNLEIYLTALIALVVGVLGVFSVVRTEVVAAATLATLAVMAVNALTPRHQVADLDERVAELGRLVERRINGDVSADAVLTTVKQGLEQRIAQGDDIRLVGVTLSRTIRNHFVDLESRLRQGATVKVLLIDPERGIPQEAARRSTVPDHPEIFENRVRSTIDLLRQLALAPGARLEVRFTGFVPAFGLAMVDPDTRDGVIHVELGTHHSAGPDPVFTLAAGRDHRWYGHFMTEFEHMWEHGRPAAESDGFP